MYTRGTRSPHLSILGGPGCCIYQLRGKDREIGVPGIPPTGATDRIWGVNGVLIPTWGVVSTQDVYKDDVKDVTRDVSRDV